MPCHLAKHRPQTGPLWWTERFFFAPNQAPPTAHRGDGWKIALLLNARARVCVCVPISIRIQHNSDKAGLPLGHTCHLGKRSYFPNTDPVLWCICIFRDSSTMQSERTEVVVTAQSHTLPSHHPTIAIVSCRKIMFNSLASCFCARLGWVLGMKSERERELAKSSPCYIRLRQTFR